MRVCVAIRLDVGVAQHVYEGDDLQAAADEVRRVASRYITHWLNQGLPTPPAGVSVELKRARTGRVARD